jgi:hypothetical protein
MSGQDFAGTWRWEILRRQFCELRTAGLALGCPASREGMLCICVPCCDGRCSLIRLDGLQQCRRSEWQYVTFASLVGARPIPSSPVTDPLFLPRDYVGDHLLRDDNGRHFVDQWSLAVKGPSSFQVVAHPSTSRCSGLFCSLSARDQTS